MTSPTPPVKFFSLPVMYCGTCGSAAHFEPSYQPLEAIAKKGHVTLACYNKGCDQFHVVARVPVSVLSHDPV